MPLVDITTRSGLSEVNLCYIHTQGPRTQRLTSHAGNFIQKRFIVEEIFDKLAQIA